MPIYEYVCGACGHAFEHLARRLDEKKPACPECGARRTEKQWSAFSTAQPKDEVPSCATGRCNVNACPSGTCPVAARA